MHNIIHDGCMTIDGGLGEKSIHNFPVREVMGERNSCHNTRKHTHDITST